MSEGRMRSSLLLVANKVPRECIPVQIQFLWGFSETKSHFAFWEDVIFQTFDRCIDSPVKINYNKVKTTKEAVAFESQTLLPSMLCCKEPVSLFASCLQRPDV